MIYYHGGGCIFYPLGFDCLCSRYAAENDLVVFLPDYRLAPETPYPGGYTDCYATLKWVLANVDSYGIDKDMICIAGESGGGSLTLNVARMLAEKDEQDLVKLAMVSTPMCSPHE